MDGWCRLSPSFGSSPTPELLKMEGNTSRTWLGQNFLYSAISCCFTTRIWRCSTPSRAWCRFSRPRSCRPVVGVKIVLFTPSCDRTKERQRACVLDHSTPQFSQSVFGKWPPSDHKLFVWWEKLLHERKHQYYGHVTSADIFHPLGLHCGALWSDLCHIFITKRTAWSHLVREDRKSHALELASLLAEDKVVLFVLRDDKVELHLLTKHGRAKWEGMEGAVGQLRT